MTNAGLRFFQDLFLVSDHLTLATNDEYGPAAAFLGTHGSTARRRTSPTSSTRPRTTRRPRRVADHAYWLSGLRVRKSGAGRHDRRPLGGVRRRRSPRPRHGAEHRRAHRRRARPDGRTRSASATGATPRRRRGRASCSWGRTTSRGATVDSTRARTGCAPKLYLAVDGPLGLSVTCVQKPKRAKRGAERVGDASANRRAPKRRGCGAAPGSRIEARGGGPDPPHGDPAADPPGVCAGLRGAGRRRRPGDHAVVHTAVRRLRALSPSARARRFALFGADSATKNAHLP